MEKVWWKNNKDLEEKVKNIEGEVSIGHSIDLQHRTLKGKVDTYMFFVSAS
jgi:hypothetical protein